MVGSPPPWRAAMMIARLSLLHSLPRLASMAPFLCLMVAQCECPDMGVSSVAATPAAGRRAVRSLGFQESQFLLQVAVALVRAPPLLLLVQAQRPLPGVAGPGRQFQPVVDVAQVVPDRRVVAVGQGGGLFQLAAGPLQVAAAEEHPAQAVDVGRVLALRLGL